MITIKKNFFVKQIVLIFSLIRTAFLVWDIKFEKRKALKKKKISEELLPVARHPKRWWNICLSEDEKKEIEPIFY